MNKKKYLTLLIFIATLFILDYALSKVIPFYAKKQKHDKRIELLLNAKINPQILVLGSSRALNNYNPQIIESITHKTCYNLGFSGSNILFHETILDLMIEGNHLPSLIIYNIDDFGTLYNVDGIEYRKDVLLPFVENDIVNRNINSELGKSNWVSMICKTYRQNVNFVNALRYLVYGEENNDYKTTNIDNWGANLMVQRAEDSIPKYISKRTEPKLSQLNIAYYKAYLRIQEKCAAHGIKLMICFPPLFTKTSENFKKQIKNRKLLQ